MQDDHTQDEDAVQGLQPHHNHNHKRMHSHHQTHVMKAAPEPEKLMVYKAQNSQTFACTIYFLCALYTCSTMAVISGYLTPNLTVLTLDGEYQGKALPDRGRDIITFIWGPLRRVLPQSALAVDWRSTIIGLWVVPVVVLIFANKQRAQVLRRTLAILGTIFLLRALCMGMTFLPDPAPRCISQFEDSRGAYKEEAIFPAALKRGFKVALLPLGTLTCGDMIFCGLTVFAILNYLLARFYFTPERAWGANCPSFVKSLLHLVRFHFTLGAVILPCYLVGSGLHYSLDVFIASLATHGVWWLYHLYAEIPQLRHSSKLMSWLEQ